MIRAGRVTTALTVTLLAVAGPAACTSGSGSPVWEPVDPSPVLPRPVGVEDPAEVPAVTSADADCDPRASLRPDAPPAALPAADELTAGSMLAAIADRGRLVVGVDQNTYLFGFRDPHTAELSGFDIDLAHILAEAMFGDPERIQFVAVSSADRIPAIESGEVDLVVRTMTMTCERWKRVAFSSEYYTAGQRVLVRRDSPVTGLPDLAGQKVCAAAGSTSLRNLAATTPSPVPVSVIDWSDCLVLLQQGDVAAVSTDDTILAGMAAQDPTTHVVGETFSTEPYGVAMPADADDLVRYVNAVLTEIRADGTWTTLYERWLSPLGPAPDPPTPRYQD